MSSNIIACSCTYLLSKEGQIYAAMNGFPTPPSAEQTISGPIESECLRTLGAWNQGKGVYLNEKGECFLELSREDYSYATQIRIDAPFRTIDEALAHEQAFRIRKAAENRAKEDERKERDKRYNEQREKEAAEAQSKRFEREHLAQVREASKRAWIERFGSRRLMFMLANGIEHEETYRLEYLALNFPKWKRYNDLPGHFNSTTIADISEEAIELFEEARALIPTAQLRMYESALGEREDITWYRVSAHILIPGDKDETTLVYERKVKTSN